MLGCLGGVRLFGCCAGEDQPGGEGSDPGVKSTFFMKAVKIAFNPAISTSF